MKFDVKVQNLGKINYANFRIRPITVITTPNATVKVFCNYLAYFLKSYKQLKTNLNTFN